MQNYIPDSSSVVLSKLIGLALRKLFLSQHTSLFGVREVTVEGDGLPVAFRLVALFPLLQNGRPLRPLLANPRGLEVPILQGRKRCMAVLANLKGIVTCKQSSRNTSSKFGFWILKRVEVEN